MIPIVLLDGLVDRFKDELKGYKLRDPRTPGAYKEINVFSQHLPVKNKETDKSLFPYLCIRLRDGEEQSADDPGTCQILFIAGVFDRSDDNQGFRDSVALVNKVYQSLIRSPKINDQFELVHPIRWAYQEEDSEPYYFAGLETNWAVPKPIREDVEHLI